LGLVVCDKIPSHQNNHNFGRPARRLARVGAAWPVGLKLPKQERTSLKLLAPASRNSPSPAKIHRIIARPRCCRCLDPSFAFTSCVSYQTACYRIVGTVPAWHCVLTRASDRCLTPSAKTRARAELSSQPSVSLVYPALSILVLGRHAWRSIDECRRSHCESDI
jgi:hypothetical protein